MKDVVRFARVGVCGRAIAGGLLLATLGLFSGYAGDLAAQWHIGSRFQPGPDRGKSSILMMEYAGLMAIATLAPVQVRAIVRVIAVAAGCLA
jgi:hypothetical protein